MLKTEDRILIEQRVQNEKPSIGVTYFFALFIVGTLGAHRFYLGRTTSAIVMLVLTLTMLGAIITVPWLFIDLFRIPGMVRARVDEIRDKITAEVRSMKAAEENPLAHAPLVRP